MIYTAAFFTIGYDSLSYDITTSDIDDVRMCKLEGQRASWPGSGGLWSIGNYQGLSANGRPMWSCISPHSGARINVMIPPTATLA